MKEYLVSLLTTNGRTKNIIVEAMSCQEAQELSSKKYPSYKVNRITADEKDIRYFSTMKEMRKQK